MTTQWAVVFNPNAGAKTAHKDKEFIKNTLDKYNVNYSWHETQNPGQAEEITNKLCKEGTNSIIVTGGDGTLNEVINGVFKQSYTPPENIKLAVIPVGTGNDWCRTFQVPFDYNEAVNLIKQEKTLKQDIGKIKFDINGKSQTRYFGNIAGFGFDALVAQKANSLKSKGRKGFLVYLYGLLSSFFQYRACSMQINLDNGPINEKVFSVCVGIGMYNGGGMKQVPNAVPNDGKFRVTLIKNIGLPGIIKNLPGLYDGTFIKDHRVAQFETQSLSLSSSKKILSEVDGEVIGYSAFEISIVPQSLEVVVGSGLDFE